MTSRPRIAGVADIFCRPMAQAFAVPGGKDQTEKKQIADVTLRLRTAFLAKVDGSLSSPRRDLSSR